MKDEEKEIMEEWTVTQEEEVKKLNLLKIGDEIALNITYKKIT